MTTWYHTWPGLTRIPDWLWSFTIWLWYMICDLTLLYFTTDWSHFTSLDYISDHLTRSPTSLYLTIKYLTDFDYITTWLDYISTSLLYYISLHNIRLTDFITFDYNTVHWYHNLTRLYLTSIDFTSGSKTDSDFTAYSYFTWLSSIDWLQSDYWLYSLLHYLFLTWPYLWFIYY